MATDETSMDQVDIEQPLETAPGPDEMVQLGVRMGAVPLPSDVLPTTTHHPFAIPGLALLRARLGPVELRRRLWHILPGFLPFLLWPFPSIMIPPHIRLGILTAVTFAVGLVMFVRYSRIRRTGEPASDRYSILGYSGSVLLMLLFFPVNTELALTVLAILAFGDGCATLGGKLFGGRRLPWNSRKSFAGLICFLFCGTIMGAIIYWCEANHRQLPAVAIPVRFASAALCAFIATTVAAIVESIPLRTNDNLNVGVAASLAVIVAQSVFVGW